MKYHHLIIFLLFSYITQGQIAVNALSYDGINEYTTLGNPTGLQLPDYTITLWFYSEDNTKSILTRGTSQGSNASKTFDLYGNGSDLVLFLNSNGGAGHSHNIGTYAINQWNHIAITKEDSLITTILNGRNPTTSIIPFVADNTSYSWDLGGNGSFTFQGKLDEFRIWDNARDLDLIRDKMHSKYTYWTGLVGAYRFNETTGTILPDTDAPNEDGTNINMDDSNWITSYAPIGNETSRGRMNQRGIWQATGTDETLDSDGFSLSADVALTESNYATYGHDNLARLNQISNTDLPTGVTERYEEEWYIDEYGTVYANVIFDLNKIWGSAIIAGQTADYCLLFRSGTSGVFTKLTATTSIQGNSKIIFDNILLQDGYYTLGTSNISNSPIQEELTHGQSYFGADNYTEYIPGNLPIIIVAPHGGSLEPVYLPMVLDRGRDGGSFQSSLMLIDSMIQYTDGCRPHIIINHLHPRLFVGTGTMFGSAGFHPEVQQAWSDYHNFIEIAKTNVTNDWGAGHYFEMHTTGRDRNQIGLGINASTLNETDAVLATKASSSTVKNLCTVGGADFLEVIKGPNCLGSLLQDANRNSSPSYDDPQPADPFFYAGKNTWRHGSNDAGVIDATHVESHWGYINVSAERPQYSGDLAASMITFMETFYGFNLNCSTLPIELINFEAFYLAEQEHVKLIWSTTSEINNDYFIVEKSLDGENWEEIGRVQGAGNSSIKNTYSEIDEAPKKGVINYYRLKQVDLDKTFLYSKKRALYIKNDFNEEIIISPNPCGKKDKLYFTNKENINRITLFSITGNKINAPNLINGYLPKNISSGMYFIRIELKYGSIVSNKIIVK